MLGSLLARAFSMQGPPAAGPDLLPRAPDRPRVTAIIPVRNLPELAEEAVASVLSEADQVPLEVLVVDNGSAPESAERLLALARSDPRVGVLRFAENRGFPAAVNRGALLARGQYLLVMNSDARLGPGCLGQLVEALDSRPELGVVSPVTNYVGEGEQLDPGAVGLEPGQVAEYSETLRPRGGEVVTVPDRLVFFCVLLRRDLFWFLGGLWEGYGLGNYEDDDFCLRARLAGYSLGILRGAFCYHHGTRTWQAEGLSHPEWMERNRSLFYERMAGWSLLFPSRPRHLPPYPRISVVVRTKDRPGLLRKALLSLANQTLSPFEVVVVNDGGEPPESCLAELEPFLKLKLVCLKGGRGRGAALNAGCSAARGDFLAYLDDDDLLYPNHLEVLARALTASESPLVYSRVNMALVDGDAVVCRAAFPPLPFDPAALLAGNRIPNLCILHTREVWERVGGYREDLEYLEDWEYLLRALSLGAFLEVPRVTGEYRFYLDRLAGPHRVAEREGVLRACLEIYRLHPTSDPRVLPERERALEIFEAQARDARKAWEEGVPLRQEALRVAREVLGFPLGCTGSV